ncbi:hypothetical protein WME75_29490 [Sorangium sp. So ce1014]|uniref:hypothetical protein n=1 Tax=Sorangium sp. So ce1014 TaxID=3133326 RepID=UPI003F5EE17C
MPAFRHALALALDAGDPSLVRVGESFASSARTPQRRLAAVGVRHRELLRSSPGAPAGAAAGARAAGGRATFVVTGLARARFRRNSPEAQAPTCYPPRR